MRLGLLLLVALLAIAESGAVLAESVVTDFGSVDAELAPMAVESDDNFVANDELAGTEEPASALAADEWVEASEPVVESEITIEGSPIVANGITLGPVGVDAKGHVGRVHTVVKGDTLWDVSHAYLGTAWVWPSVWDENSKIQNPHLINPGDRLWISSTEIRAISEDEANQYLADAESILPAAEDVTAAESDDVAVMEVEDEGPAALDDFATDELDPLPVNVYEQAKKSNETGRKIRVAMRENMGFVSDVQLKASTSILGSPADRHRLSMLDTIYLGLGKGEVKVGDEYTLFRSITEVRSPTTHDLLGHHVEVMGWAEVTEVDEESCVAVIRSSVDGAEKGDRAMPRVQPPVDIAVKFPKGDIAGEIAFLPASRTLMGQTDYVFVDIGAVHGVEIGTDLEVFDPGHVEMDKARDMKRKTPDRVIADLVVITVQEESSVAYIAHTRRELAVGDSVRGSTRDFPSAF